MTPLDRELRAILKESARGTFRELSGFPVLEVNHCHGPGRGHPCIGKDAFRSARSNRMDRLNALLKKGLVKVVSDKDQSVWWTTPEVAATGFHRGTRGIGPDTPDRRPVTPFPKDAFGRWTGSKDKLAKGPARLRPKKRKKAG